MAGTLDISKCNDIKYILLTFRTCCPWRHGQKQQKKKKLQANVAVPPDTVQVPNQWPLALSVTSNDEGSLLKCHQN